MESEVHQVRSSLKHTELFEEGLNTGTHIHENYVECFYWCFLFIIQIRTQQNETQTVETSAVIISVFY